MHEMNSWGAPDLSFELYDGALADGVLQHLLTQVTEQDLLALLLATEDEDTDAAGEARKDFLGMLGITEERGPARLYATGFDPNLN